MEEEWIENEGLPYWPNPGEPIPKDKLKKRVTELPEEEATKISDGTGSTEEKPAG